jgi:glycosyltransferase involved in cell wall biosynthesis
MVERDKQIAGLHDVIASRDEQIGLLNQDTGEKEKQISDLNQTMIGKEKIINEVTQLLTHSHESLSKLTSSLRWRITRPVELLSNACDGMKKRLQKYVAAIRIYRTHRASGVFDPVWYLEKNADVRSSWMHPWWHFLFFGITENRAPNVNFYPEAYMSINHDVAGSHLGAVEHYMTFGWKEGRNLGGNPNITDWVNHYRLQLADLDKSKKTVLIVTHEITRTGAPILVLNLADKLRRDFNTIILSLGGGPLLADFEKASDIFIGPLMGLQSSQDFLSEFIKGINVIHSIDCALVNSIVNVPILKPLWENNVPSANLIHEFASNRRPHSLFLESMFFSTKQVYSSNLILENALKYHQYIKNKNPLVLPQGRCKPPVEKNNDQLIEREKSRIETLFKTEGDLNKTFIVIGLGTVQLRKGVDLFLECAQRVKRIQSKVPIRFVWFGHGYDPELDGEYSVYLQQRIECSGLESMCFITHESDQLDHIYTNANLLFLSSRLDPLPLVAQDMLSYGKPVVCFDQATGLAEYFKKDKTLRKLVCDYLDVEDAARKIVELANDQKKYLDVCIAADNLSKKTFDFDIYVKEISELCDSIIKDNQNVTSEELIINEAGVLQPDFFGFGWGMPQGDNQTRNYLSLWSMGFCNKKPFPGFHPGIYALSKIGRSFGRFP